MKESPGEVGVDESSGGGGWNEGGAPAEMGGVWSGLLCWGRGTERKWEASGRTEGLGLCRKWDGARAASPRQGRDSRQKATLRLRRRPFADRGVGRGGGAGVACRPDNREPRSGAAELRLVPLSEGPSALMVRREDERGREGRAVSAPWAFPVRDAPSRPRLYLYRGDRPRVRPRRRRLPASAGGGRRRAVDSARPGTAGEPQHEQALACSVEAWVCVSFPTCAQHCFSKSDLGDLLEM